jgi:hypothetical protein
MSSKHVEVTFLRVKYFSPYNINNIKYMLIEFLILFFIIIIFYEIFSDVFYNNNVVYEGFVSKSTAKSSTNIKTVAPSNTVVPSSNISNVNTVSETSNNYMILSQKNAGEILLLKDQMNSRDKSIGEINTNISKLADNVGVLKDQLKAISDSKNKK